jgi:hypothetical protein
LFVQAKAFVCEIKRAGAERQFAGSYFAVRRFVLRRVSFQGSVRPARSCKLISECLVLTRKMTQIMATLFFNQASR